MLGPMKPEVRPVVFRLCVPVNAASVELVRTGLPNGPQPCSVPSSKSLLMGPVSAADVAASLSVWPGSEPGMQPNATTTHESAQPRNNVLVLICSPVKLHKMVARVLGAASA